MFGDIGHGGIVFAFGKFVNYQVIFLAIFLCFAKD
jgi:hypothetical protein